MHESIVALLAGRTIDVDGRKYKMADTGIVRQGDLYIGALKTGPNLLTAKIVRSPEEGGYIIPTTMGYWYDKRDTVRVCEVSDLENPAHSEE